MCFFVKLGRHVSHSERTDSIDFGGQRSKVKVTIDIYGNKLVNAIETKPLCAASSNLARMLAILRGRDHIDFGGQRSNVKVAIDIYSSKKVLHHSLLFLCVLNFQYL